MEKIVALGDEFKKQGPESVFTEEFWLEKGLNKVSIRNDVSVDDDYANTLGMMVTESFCELAKTRGHIVEWDVDEGIVKRLGDAEDDPVGIYKEDVNWFELRSLAIDSVLDTAKSFSKAF